MEKDQEITIRAQSMINSLGAQRLEAMDRCVFLAADLAVALEKIREMEANAAKTASPSDGA